MEVVGRGLILDSDSVAEVSQQEEPMGPHVGDVRKMGITDDSGVLPSPSLSSLKTIPPFNIQLYPP